MEQDKEQDIHEISVLTEGLFNEIKAYREFGLAKREEDAIKEFVQECARKYSGFTKKEIKDIVINILNRTFKNLKDKEDDAR